MISGGPSSPNEPRHPTQQIRRLVRPGHDLETEAGRSHERWRRIALAALGAGGFRLVSMLGTLITLPLVLGYTGRDGFGLFSVITSLSLLLAFSDLGLGNGLISSLAAANGRGESERSQRLVSTATALLIGVALLLGAAAIMVVPAVDWARLLGASGELGPQARPAVAVFALCFVVGVPSSMGQKVHFALQEGFAANLWSLFGALLAIAGTLVCISAEASIPWLVLATSGSTTLVYLLNTIYVFGRKHSILRPRWSLVHRVEVRTLSSTGALFFTLALSGAVANQTDTLVLSIILGSAAVTTYVVPLKLFSLPIMAASFVLLPLWPAYSDAAARGDSAWLRRTLKRSVVLTGALTVPSAIVLLLLGDTLIPAWTNGNLRVPWSVLLAFATWTAVNFLQGPIAMFLNGVGVVRFQVVSATLMAVVNLPLSIALTRSIGVAGPLVATLIATAVCQTVPSLVVTMRILRDLEHHGQYPRGDVTRGGAATVH